MFKRPACVVATSILLTAALLAVTVSGCHSVSASQDQEHISPPQIETGTVPLGYFELTVSPAEVCANVGEQIEIRCSIDCLINTVVEVSSVDMLLFDSYDSVIREQAMTKDSYWSANTEYTVVGDEAYYQLKVNFTFPLGKPEEYSEYGAHFFPIVVNQQPIEIVSVLGPVRPFTPAGPAVKMTLKNVGVEPVISLTATLEVSSASGIPFDFTFDDVTPANPLQPNRSTSATLILIGGGFSSDVSFPLTINATLQNGDKFVYTKLVQIVKPPLNIGGIFTIRRQIWGSALAGAICVLFPPYVAVFGIPAIIFIYLSKSDL